MRVVATDYAIAEAGAATFAASLGDVTASLRNSGVADGFPFLVHASGEYDSNLNRILRLLPTYGVRSQRSIATYAGVYAAFQRFLDERRGGKSVWEADRDDFQALYVVRRLDVATRQSKATWNLWVATLDKLYAVALDEGLVGAHPLPRRLAAAWTERGPVTVERNAAYEPDGGQRPVKYLSLDDYRLWRQHGLLGVMAPYPRLRELHELAVDLCLLGRPARIDHLGIDRDGERVPAEASLSTARPPTDLAGPPHGQATRVMQRSTTTAESYRRASTPEGG